MRKKVARQSERRSNRPAKRLPEKGERVVVWGTRGRSVPERAAYIIIPLLIVVVAIILLSL